ncbi:MAG TPA: FCD domain-containing protein [Dongiaceae bacterium]|nr:FCD domain-containing protein [Dongiaceae bacterium]
MTRRETAAAKLRRLLDSNQYPQQSRLPAERQLCGTLDLSRSALREGLEVLEAEGRLWRHVGKGTFVGSKPALPAGELAVITAQTSPVEVMATRVVIEPALARLAALHATEGDIANMWHLIEKSEAARDARTWESWDGTLHRAIAAAAHNNLLLAIFDGFNAIRRQEGWRRLRAVAQTDARLQHYREQHRLIVDAIAGREAERAEAAMRRHLQSVRDNLLGQSHG